MTTPEPIEITLERVGDVVDVLLFSGHEVSRKLRHDERGFFIYNVGLRIPVRQIQYSNFVQHMRGEDRYADNS
jgi:hypothetical protein